MAKTLGLSNRSILDADAYRLWQAVRGEHRLGPLRNTSVDPAVGSGIVWIGVDHRCRGSDSADWSDAERTGMIALISGYIVVKLIAETHASLAAQHFNEERRSLPVPRIVPTSGAVVGRQGTF